MINEKTLRIGFIGCGKMAQALAKGFIASGNKSIFHLLFYFIYLSESFRFLISTNTFGSLLCFHVFIILKQGITKSENIIGSSPRIDSTFIEEFSVS